MKLRQILQLTAAATLLSGCAHPGYVRDRYTFGEHEVRAWHESAVQAVASPEEWLRVGEGKLTRGHLELDAADFEYNLHCRDPHQIEIVLRFPARAGEDFPLVRIRLDRGTCLVMSMKEEIVKRCKGVDQ